MFKHMVIWLKKNKAGKTTDVGAGTHNREFVMPESYARNVGEIIVGHVLQITSTQSICIPVTFVYLYITSLYHLITSPL